MGHKQSAADARTLNYGDRWPILQTLFFALRKPAVNSRDIVLALCGARRP